MAGRVQALAAVVRDEYAGDAASPVDDGHHRGPSSWPASAPSPAPATRRRASSRPCSASRLGVRPDGWAEACGAYAETGSFRSVADVVDGLAPEGARLQEGRQGRREGQGLRMPAAPTAGPEMVCATCGAVRPPSRRRPLTWSRGT